MKMFLLTVTFGLFIALQGETGQQPRGRYLDLSNIQIITAAYKEEQRKTSVATTSSTQTTSSMETETSQPTSKKSTEAPKPTEAPDPTAPHIMPEFIRPEVLSKTTEPTQSLPNKATNNFTTMSPLSKAQDVQDTVAPDNHIKEQTKTIKLHVISIMYYVAPGILLLGIVAQLVIARLNRTFFFAYITQFWYSIADLMILGAFFYSLRSTPNKTTCKIAWFANMVAVGCLSIATLLMTLYKFILIRFPVAKRKITTVKKQILWCFGCLAFVALISSPMLWWSSLSEQLGTKRNFCHFQGDTYLYFILSWLAVTIALPVLLNLIMLILIGKKVVEHKRKTEARMSRFLPSSSTQVTMLSSVDNAEDDATLLKKKRTSAPTLANLDNAPAPRFPTIIIISMTMTISTSLPFVPAFVNPSWFYSTTSRTFLQIIYGAMLLCIALSPFVHLAFSKKTKETIVKIWKMLKKLCRCICLCR